MIDIRNGNELLLRHWTPTGASPLNEEKDRYIEFIYNVYIITSVLLMRGYQHFILASSGGNKAL